MVGQRKKEEKIRGEEEGDGSFEKLSSLHSRGEVKSCRHKKGFWYRSRKFVTSSFVVLVGKEG